MEVIPVRRTIRKRLARYILIYRWCLELPWAGGGRGYVLGAGYGHLAVPLAKSIPHSVLREAPPPATLVSKSCTQADCEIVQGYKLVLFYSARARTF